MAKKLTLDDLKVQSFVTTLNADQADRLVGGTQLNTVCACTDGVATDCGSFCDNGVTQRSNCCTVYGPDCTGGDTQMGCPTVFTDTCDCTNVCTQEFSYCNCTSAEC
jgi:hypothetical protein